MAFLTLEEGSWRVTPFGLLFFVWLLLGKCFPRSEGMSGCPQDLLNPHSTLVSVAQPCLFYRCPLDVNCPAVKAALGLSPVPLSSRALP